MHMNKCWVAWQLGQVSGKSLLICACRNLRYCWNLISVEPVLILLSYSINVCSYLLIEVGVSQALCLQGSSWWCRWLPEFEFLLTLLYSSLLNGIGGQWRYQILDPLGGQEGGMRKCSVWWSRCSVRELGGCCTLDVKMFLAGYWLESLLRYVRLSFG